jgi:hypothetical protein
VNRRPAGEVRRNECLEFRTQRLRLRTGYTARDVKKTKRIGNARARSQPSWGVIRACELMGTSTD